MPRRKPATSPEVPVDLPEIPKDIGKNLRKSSDHDHPWTGYNSHGAPLSNLKPFKKGEVSNPYGRKGKDGKKGFSLKKSFKIFLANLSDDQKQAIWVGLHRKARTGDSTAIKLMMEINDEWDNKLDLNVTNGLGCVILPPKEPKIKDDNVG